MIFLLTILQILFRLIAPIVAPIALLFAVKTDERNKTWAPAYEDDFPKQMRRLPRWLRFMETPDDQLIPSGLYEPTVMKIYKKYGWFVSQWIWYNRNCAHGLFYPYGFNCDHLTDQQIEALKKKKTFLIFEIRYGHKVLNDWYGVYGGKMYAMPRFTVRIRK